VTLLAVFVRMALRFRDRRGLGEARRQAATDELTALPNRRTFMQRMASSIRASRVTGQELWVVMLDLDNFKELNDTLGHNAGDALLRLIGPRLEAVLRATDTVARLGGDEFAVLLQPGISEHGAREVAEKILRSLDEPFEVARLALRLTASIRMAAFPTHAQDDEELLSRADFAMYQAKAQRRGFQVYASDSDTSSPERLSLTAELADALAGDGIEVHFQPKADIFSRRIRGLEALVRWRRPDGRLIPPADFVRAAEHAGLSRPLTRRFLELALDQLVVWRADLIQGYFISRLLPASDLEPLLLGRPDSGLYAMPAPSGG
jgi:diguanylate cyclase (GGDEF)-like protein